MFKGSRHISLALLSILFCAVMFARGAYALPQDGQFAAGSGSIQSPSQNQMEVIQNTDKAIINWQSFGIDPSEAVNFVQPGSSSVVLNRVVGVDPSVILGMLSANGNVFLLNPNGVIIGQGAVIDVGSFLTSTMDMSDEDFLNGNYRLLQDPGKPLSYVINEGTINTAEGGYAVLAAPHVANYGKITASLGTVELAAGEEAYLSLTPDGLLGFTVDGPVTGEVVGPDGAVVETNVLNAGEINADGGTVVLEASTAYDTVKSVVNNEGIIEARAIYDDGGTIVLLGEDGIVENSGMLDASGKGEGQNGGTVQVFGKYAGLKDGSSIDVSGSSGGGEVLVGGDYQGKGEVPNSERTFVAKDASINADAIDSGDGGKVIVWADGVTRYYGSISARGGASGGNGGFAEVSGESLTFEGTADLTAPNGELGTVLLDPNNITISTVGTTGGYTDVNSYAAGTDDPEVIHPNTLNGVGGNILLQAHNDITVSSNVVLSTPGASMALNAGDDIVFTNSYRLATNNGDITLVANHPGGNQFNTGTPGAITMVDGSSLESGTGVINLQAQGDITLGSLQSTSTDQNAISIATSEGAIVDGGNAATDIVAGSGGVRMQASTGIGSSNALETQVGTLYAYNDSSGAINISETNDIVILYGVNWGGGFSLTSGGNIILPDLLSVAIDGINASGPVTLEGVNVYFNDTDNYISAGGNNVTVRAQNDIVLGGNTIIDTGGGSPGDIVFEADSDGSGAGVFTMDDTATISSGLGTVSISAAGDVTLGGIMTSSASATAVSVTSTAGGIVDGGDTYLEINAPNGGAVLTAVTGIGAGNPLEIVANPIVYNLPAAPTGTTSTTTTTTIDQAQNTYTDPASGGGTTLPTPDGGSSGGSAPSSGQGDTLVSLDPGLTDPAQAALDAARLEYKTLLDQANDLKRQMAEAKQAGDTKTYKMLSGQYKAIMVELNAARVEYKEALAAAKGDGTTPAGDFARSTAGTSSKDKSEYDKALSELKAAQQAYERALKKVRSIKQQMAKAKKAGNKAAYKKLSKSLRKAKADLRQKQAALKKAQTKVAKLEKNIKTAKKKADAKRRADAKKRATAQRKATAKAKADAKRQSSEKKTEKISTKKTTTKNTKKKRPRTSGKTTAPTATAPTSTTPTVTSPTATAPGSGDATPQFSERPGTVIGGTKGRAPQQPSPQGATGDATPQFSERPGTVIGGTKGRAPQQPSPQGATGDATPQFSERPGTAYGGKGSPASAPSPTATVPGSGDAQPAFSERPGTVIGGTKGRAPQQPSPQGATGDATPQFSERPGTVIGGTKGRAPQQPSPQGATGDATPSFSERPGTVIGGTKGRAPQQPSPQGATGDATPQFSERPGTVIGGTKGRAPQQPSPQGATGDATPQFSERPGTVIGGTKGRAPQQPSPQGATGDATPQFSERPGTVIGGTKGRAPQQPSPQGATGDATPSFSEHPGTAYGGKGSPASAPSPTATEPTSGTDATEVKPTFSEHPGLSFGAVKGSVDSASPTDTSPTMTSPTTVSPMTTEPVINDQNFPR